MGTPEPEIQEIPADHPMSDPRIAGAVVVPGWLKKYWGGKARIYINPRPGIKSSATERQSLILSGEYKTKAQRRLERKTHAS